MKPYSAFTALLAFLAACTPSDSEVNPPNPTGTPTSSLAGKVVLGTSVTSQALRRLEGMAYVPNEVIVRFKNGVSVQSVGSLQVNGVSLQQVRPLALPQTVLLRAQGNLGVSDMLTALRARGDVLYAQPNHIYRRSATVNDPLFTRQCDLPAMNIPAAWDIEAGFKNPVTVAVVDTGIAPGHPEFSGKLLPGYDFVSTSASGDGNGRDSDPTDPGGAADGYHGSHVAGTIAASTNNNIGIAGISQGAKILPVRGLGVGGTGTTADIVDAIAWAAGLPVSSTSGTLTNPNPAQVINLSLGSGVAGNCDAAEQNIFDQVRTTKDAIFVVAAGNASAEAARYAPGNCAGVITVGATDIQGRRAFYSNHGLRVDVMAPGGDTHQSFSVQGASFPAGILSTVLDAQGASVYEVYQGTSMATPHVTGLVALMKSLKPSLTTAEALYILRKTSRPLSNTQCKGDNEPTLQSADCGAGLVDAAAALSLLKTSAVAPFALFTEPARLRLSPQTTSSVVVSFAGVSPINLQVVGLPSGVSASFTDPVMTIKSQLNLTISGAVTKGDYPLKIIGTVGSVTYERPILLRIGNPTPTVEEAEVFACYRIRASDGSVDCDISASDITFANSSGAFDFPNLYAGVYDLVGWQDATEDDKFNAGDYAGFIEQVRSGTHNAQVKLELLTSQ